jgi:hypothetical protein
MLNYCEQLRKDGKLAVSSITAVANNIAGANMYVALYLKLLEHEGAMKTLDEVTKT